MARVCALGTMARGVVAMMALSGSVLAKDWYVDANAGSGGDGSSSHPFKTITAALNVAQDADRILVTRGTYAESLLIAASVTILGDASGGTLLRPVQARGALVSSGKAVWLQDFDIGGGVAPWGGGIQNFGTLTAVRCRIHDCAAEVFTNNYPVAAGGGGVDNEGTTVLFECEISSCSVYFILNIFMGDDGEAGDGGGIHNVGSLKLFSCTVANNSVVTRHYQPFSFSAAGGGISNYGSLRLVNTTVSGNTIDSVTSSGGGVFTSFASGVTAYLDHSTIASNIVWGNADIGGGTAYGGGIEGDFTFGHTILADNSVNVDAGGYSGNPDLSGTGDSLGYNLVEDLDSGQITGDATGNQIGVDPMLAPLANNGGFVDTHALLAGSPCIDAGNPDPRVSPPYDARVYPRALWDPAVGVSDIGAFEFGGAPSFRLTATPDVPLPPGALLDVTTGGGIFHAPLLLALVQVNGTPTFTPLLLTAFDQSGVSYVAATVPPGLSGLTVEFESFSLDAKGRVIATNVVTVVFA